MLISDLCKMTSAKQSEEAETEPKFSIIHGIQSVTVRVVLIIHSLLTTWRAADIKKDNIYWCIGLGNILLVLEGLFTLRFKKGQEGKWFCPCFLLYLCSTLPSIWILEVDRLDRYDSTIADTNLTAIQEETLSTIKGVTLPIALTADTWIQLLEQSMMFFLIIGRWLLPRGELTRNELSQLLFVYLGTGSDILELFIVFEESEVRQDRLLSYIVLIVWSVSLMQFTFVITATKSPRRPRVFLTKDPELPQTNNDSILKENSCLDVSVCYRSLGTNIIHRDYRHSFFILYILIARRILSYGILFFACKNLIVIGVVIYRIVVIACCMDPEKSKKFCPCFLLFLLCNVPPMWILKMEHLFATAMPSPFNSQYWPNVLEQTMIFILIIGRWYLPRGELTRSQLSQLLFTFIGTGSDALEIFVVFEEAEVRSNATLCLVTLFVWSISLLQFLFVLTAVRDENKLDKTSSIWSIMLTTDIWSLLLTAVLHDLPYFFLRVYVLLSLQVYSYGILFFTCKNLILIAAMIYRIEILCFHKNDYEEIN
ncbi:LOW QUALITY PROTEIN: hypothetical protein KUTeg_004139 [Tegillarca granosa]|uniref:Transmembrane protein 26 n=1 Tax=Tegillarca granosa TaxID=220873 RepID=A0ABQ9FTM3_TEGGR|nr:LOW QUALITY PROTEIN: hypothetical protein KUTeg_004139 [Tegillarca granosa]